MWTWSTSSDRITEEILKADDVRGKMSLLEKEGTF